MSKEKQTQKYESKQLIDELSKMPPMVIVTVYLYAINYTRYGVDVTEKWLTAIQNASSLEKAYRKGYYDAMERVNQASKASEFLQELKWETCFDCPLSHGCPKIKGCTNEQAIEYASQIPNDCPLSVQPEIIRCKDCKHLQKWRSEESAMEFGQIYECGKGVLRDPLPDGSCSKAERRTDG